MLLPLAYVAYFICNWRVVHIHHDSQHAVPGFAPAPDDTVCNSNARAPLAITCPVHGAAQHWRGSDLVAAAYRCPCCTLYPALPTRPAPTTATGATPSRSSTVCADGSLPASTPQAHLSHASTPRNVHRRFLTYSPVKTALNRNTHRSPSTGCSPHPADNLQSRCDPWTDCRCAQFIKDLHT